MKKFAKEIKDFLEKHAKVSPSYDPKYDDESEKYTSPDASILHVAAEVLEEKGVLIDRVWSDWGSGGYGPYSDKKAREWHDSIVDRLTKK